MDPNIAGLVAYSGDNKRQLLRKLYFTLQQLLSGFMPMYNVKTKTNLHKLIIGSGLKPYTGIFKARANDITYSNRTILPEMAQRDLSLDPKKYVDTWMAQERGKGESANNQTIPYAEFFWETVIQSMINELVTQTVYYGVGKDAFDAFDAGTAYAVGDLVTYTVNDEVRYFECKTATNAAETPVSHAAKWKDAGAKAITKGLKAIFADAVTANLLTPVATGAIDKDFAYEQYTEMWRSLPEQVRLEGGIIHGGLNSYDCLNDSYENKVSKNFETIDGITYLAKTDRKCIIKNEAWLSGSGCLIATKANNLVLATDELNDMSDLKVMPQMYHLDMGATFMLALNFQDEEVLSINDQA